MKKIFALTIVLLISTSAFAADKASEKKRKPDSMECYQSIQTYDSSTSEVDTNANRQTALDTCAAEFKHQPKAQKIVAPLLKECDALGNASGGGDAGPHLADSCKIDAYRFAINFETFGKK